MGVFVILYHFKPLDPPPPDPKHARLLQPPLHTLIPLDPFVQQQKKQPSLSKLI